MRCNFRNPEMAQILPALPPQNEWEKLVPFKGEKEDRGMLWWVQDKCPLSALVNLQKAPSLKTIATASTPSV